MAYGLNPSSCNPLRPCKRKLNLTWITTTATIIIIFCICIALFLWIKSAVAFEVFDHSTLHPCTFFADCRHINFVFLALEVEPQHGIFLLTIKFKDSRLKMSTSKSDMLVNTDTAPPQQGMFLGLILLTLWFGRQRLLEIALQIM